MDKCTCKITPGTSAYGGNQIDSRGCEKHDTRDEIIEQLRQERDNALRYTELLIAERDTAQAEVARAVEALRNIREELATIASGKEEEIRNDFTSGESHGWSMAYLHVVQIIGDKADVTPALDWLAQQRREAAVVELEEFADDADGIEELITCFDLRSALRTRAAALRAGELRARGRKENKIK